MTVHYQDQITIQRASKGTAIIKTKNEIDFYYAMGYVQALDRTVQMVLTRILGQGRASELLSSDDELLEIDKFFRKMNWSSGVEEELAKFSDEEKQLAQAFCDGVNAVILKKRPPEFKLIKHKPEPWEIKDSILISRLIGFIGLAQSQGETEHFALQLIQNGFSFDLVNGLFEGMFQQEDFELLKTIDLQHKLIPDAVKWANIVSPAVASNNWIAAPEKSITGKALLANDPHLETNRLPNVWYELEIHLNDRYFKGCSMPGLPACLIGRTNDLSWGATYTLMDAYDSWMERCKDGKHEYQGEWLAFTERKEIIKRKKKADHVETFYENHHGTLEGDPNKEGTYLCSKWAASSTGYQSIQAVREMFYAKTVEEGRAAMGKLEVSFNWVMADTNGTVGYQMSGKFPKRTSNWNGFRPVPGWTDEYNWQGWEDPENLPRILNPENGFFITSNQDMNEFGVANPTNNPMGDYRYRRIKELLEAKEKHSTKDFEKYQHDLYSIQARELLPIIEPVLDQSERSEILKNWDHCYNVESKGAMVFEAIYSQIIWNLIEVQAGKEVADYVITETSALGGFSHNLDRILKNEKSPWFAKISRETIIQRAIEQAWKKPIKTWGEINVLPFTNIFFGGKLPGFLGVDKGPIGLKGGRATVHQAQIFSSAGRLTSYTPSYRFVTDMGTDEIHSTLAGGASGRPWNKYYANEIDDWVNGVYKKL